MRAKDSGRDKERLSNGLADVAAPDGDGDNDDSTVLGLNQGRMQMLNN